MDDIAHARDAASRDVRGCVVVTCSRCPSGEAADRYVVYEGGLRFELPCETPELTPDVARILLSILEDLYQEKLQEGQANSEGRDQPG